MDRESRDALTTLQQEKEYYRRMMMASQDGESALRRRIAELEGRVAVLEEDKAALARQADTLQRLYEEVLNAFWWRVTKPLRWLTGLLRRRVPDPAPAPQTPAAEASPPAEPEREPFEPVPASWLQEALPAEEPLISILIPNREHMEDLSECMESIFARSSYRNFEIIIAENGSFSENIFRYYENARRQWPNVRVINWDGPFNYSAINNFAAKDARGEYILLLNNDTEVISPHWLEAMLQLARREEVGAVGAMLYYTDESIQHAGMSVSADDPNRHIGRGELRGSPGEGGILRCVRFADAVTGACLMLRRRLWDEVGGLDETFEVAYNDVDLCMRLHAAGYRNVFTPFAELYHKECRSRGVDDTPEKQLRFDNEAKRFRLRWLD